MIAIGNVRLFEEVQAKTQELTESLEQQTATAEVLSVISRLAGELEPVFDKMLENATRVCGANFGTMNLVEDGVITRVASYNVPSAYVDASDTRSFRPHPKSSLGQVIANKEAHQILDLLDSPAYLDGDPAVTSIVRNAGARSLVSVPMLRETELIGTISVYGQEVRPFSDKQIELLQQFRQAGRHRHREHAAAQRKLSTVNYDCCNSKPPPPTCSRSSAALPSISRRFSTRWWRRWRASAAPTRQ